MALTKLTTFAAIATALAALSGCVDEASTMDAPLRTGSAADEQACLSAVAQQTGNTVSIISSDFSQANTIVMVGVGPDRAPWKCLSNGGRVAEVMSMLS